MRAFGGPPATDLAREEVLVRSVPEVGPALFLYGWNRPALVLGYGQDPSTVDLSACAARGVPVLRRITGGTGVLHGADLAATLALPADHPWTRSIPGLYERFVATIVLALSGIGIAVERPAAHPGTRRPRSPICFEDDRGETLLAAGRKAVGCAQARRREGVLVHGLLLLGVDVALQAAAYGVDEARIRAALGPLADPPPAREALAEALVGAVADALRLPVVEVPPPGVDAGLLARYADPKWAPAGDDVSDTR